MTSNNENNPFKKITRSMSSQIVRENNNIVQNNSDINHQIHLLVSESKYVITNKFKQVLVSQQKDEMLNACKAELDAMQKLNVYQLVKRNSIENSPVIKRRWVFNVKQESNGDERFKARLDAKGFTQEIGQNYLETFSPVIAMDSIRFLFSLCSIKGWYIKQMDAKNAFLNGKLKYKIYFDPPNSCGNDNDIIWLK